MLLIALRTNPYTGYCLKCKEERQIEGGQPVVLKNGRHALKGQCEECGATMVIFLAGESKDEKITRLEAALEDVIKRLLNEADFGPLVVHRDDIYAFVEQYEIGQVEIERRRQHAQPGG